MAPHEQQNQWDDISCEFEWYIMWYFLSPLTTASSLSPLTSPSRRTYVSHGAQDRTSRSWTETAEGPVSWCSLLSHATAASGAAHEQNRVVMVLQLVITSALTPASASWLKLSEKTTNVLVSEEPYLLKLPSTATSGVERSGAEQMEGLGASQWRLVSTSASLLQTDVGASKEIKSCLSWSMV